MWLWQRQGLAAGSGELAFSLEESCRDKHAYIQEMSAGVET